MGNGDLQVFLSMLKFFGDGLWDCCVVLFIGCFTVVRLFFGYFRVKMYALFVKYCFTCGIFLDR